MVGRFGPYELITLAAVLIIVALVAYLIFRDARKRDISDHCRFDICFACGVHVSVRSAAISRIRTGQEKTVGRKIRV